MANTFRINEPVYQHVFESKDGLVGDDLDARALRLVQAAKAQVGVRTGGLQRSIRRYWTRERGKKLTVAVGSNRSIAALHHDGTKPHVIRARNSKALRYEGTGGEVIFAKSVNHPGTHPNRYLTDNLRLAVR
jgi:hypothetical protein